MPLQEAQGARAGLGGCCRVVTGSCIAVEAVAGVVPIDFYFGMRGLDFFNFCGGNMRVLSAEMKHYRARGHFSGIVCGAASVVANSGRGMVACGCQPGQGSTVTVADDADLFAGCGGGEVDCGRYVGEGLIDISLGIKLLAVCASAPSYPSSTPG